jgi:hypothetical protein
MMIALKYRKSTLLDAGPDKNMLDLRLEFAESCPKIAANPDHGPVRRLLSRPHRR